jgi:hypothetical protein
VHTISCCSSVELVDPLDDGAVVGVVGVLLAAPAVLAVGTVDGRSTPTAVADASDVELGVVDLAVELGLAGVELGRPALLRAGN